MENVDIAIIGAGVIGLAVANHIAEKTANLLVLEKHNTFGQETSSRNSEVIHSGIYYERGSLKARLCVEGKGLLYSFCSEHNIPHRRIGKLVVAVEDNEADEAKLLLDRGRANGLDDLQILSSDKLKAIEPNVRASCALYSPSTGILDTYTFMKRLESFAKAKGAIFAYGCEVAAIRKQNGGYRLSICDTAGEKTEVLAKVVINSAGLFSDRVAAMAGIDIDKKGYRLHYCKGEYFRVRSSKAGLVKHLIYPKPLAESLGIHTVIDLNGQMRLGPNAFYVDNIDYDVDSSHRSQFYEAARRYLPFIEEDDLTADISGIRSKLQAPGEGTRDFVISEESSDGLAGFINLIGIESPGFTASLAIAKYVDSMI